MGEEGSLSDSGELTCDVHGSVCDQLHEAYKTDGTGSEPGQRHCSVSGIQAWDGTDSEPRRKIPVNEIFCALVVCRFHTAGSGSTRITKSVTTFGAEPRMKKRGALIQVPLILLSQIYWTGRHCNAHTRITIIPQQIEKTPMMYARILKYRRRPKMRMYRIRMEILMMGIDVAHMSSDAKKACPLAELER
ncbi:MAG: hypothetical protein Q9211_000971 [Gyalolechia sp. 1 TL-2023]